MKKFLLTAVSSAALLIATSGLATASITVGNPTISGSTWNYSIQGDGLENIVNGSYFTVYDFGGYIAGSAVAPAGWTVSAQMIGTTPSTVSVPDSAGIWNLTFTYNGVTEAVPSINGFTANSTLAGNLAGQGWFSYQATKIQGGTIDQGDGNVLVPVATPEPLSMSLIGGGLALLGLARFRRK